MIEELEEQIIHILNRYQDTLSTYYFDPECITKKYLKETIKEVKEIKKETEEVLIALENVE